MISHQAEEQLGVALPVGTAAARAPLLQPRLSQYLHEYATAIGNGDILLQL